MNNTMHGSALSGLKEFFFNTLQPDACIIYSVAFIKTIDLPLTNNLAS